MCICIWWYQFCIVFQCWIESAEFECHRPDHEVAAGSEEHRRIPCFQSGEHFIILIFLFFFFLINLFFFLLSLLRSWRRTYWATRRRWTSRSLSSRTLRWCEWDSSLNSTTPEVGYRRSFKRTSIVVSCFPCYRFTFFFFFFFFFSVSF